MFARSITYVSADGAWGRWWRCRTRGLVVAAALSAAASCAGCAGGGSGHASGSPAASNLIRPGEPLPRGVVAAVRGYPITAVSLGHWIGVAYNEIMPRPNGQALPPPHFTACVAMLHRDSRPALHAQATGRRSQCAQIYSRARTAAMSFLIRAQWLEQEAVSRGVNVSTSALHRAQEAQGVRAESSAPGGSGTETGMSAADVRFKARLNLLAEALQHEAERNATVSAAEVTRYYRAHLSAYALPARRKTLTVETEKLGTARHAKALLMDGHSWATVAKRYSISFSRLIGGVFTVAPREQAPTLVKAVFAAPVGPIRGPVTVPVSDGGRTYYIFKVIGVVAGFRQPLAAVAPQIKRELTLHRQQQALARFTRSYQKRWKRLTRCRAGYVVADCR